MPVAAQAAVRAAARLGKKDKAMIKVADVMHPAAVWAAPDVPLATIAEPMDPRGIVTDAVSAHHP
jgi:hypothetical protein